MENISINSNGMKTKISFVFAVVLLVAMGLIAIVTGCNNSGTQIIYRMHHGISLVRFVQPEYKNFILINEIGNTDSVGLTLKEWHRHYDGWGFCPDYVDLGNTPYLELPDNYLMVDWKWEYIVWDNINGSVLFVPWDSLQTPISQKFPKSIGFVNNPVKDKCFLAYHILDEYRGAKIKSVYDYSLDDEKFASGYYTPCSLGIDTMKDAISQIAYYDSLQLIYQNCITEIINSGQLEKYVKLSKKLQKP